MRASRSGRRRKGIGSLRRRALGLVAALAAVAALLPASAGAALDNAGTEFWVGFPGNITSGSALTLFITGSEAASGTVEIPGLGFSESFTVTPGTVTSVSLPNNAQMSGGSSTENNGIHVTADKEVVVYGLNRLTATTDAFLGLPLDALGTSYTVLGWGTGLGGSSQFSVVAPEDGTTVTITPSVDAQGSHPAGTPFTVPLNQGEQFQLRAVGGVNDLSGTKVTSDKRVALFAGHQCANIPNNSTLACDHVVEQNPPESTWGTSFLTVPLKTRSGGDTFQFVASQDNTEIRVNGTLVATLNAGQRHQQLIDGQSEIQSTKPVLMAQYSNGSTFDGVTSDPFEMHVPPFEQFQTGYTVTTPASGFSLNFINIIAPNSAVGQINLDGTAIPPGDFTPIGSSGFSGAQVEVSLGTHSLTGNGQPFGVFVYGFDSFDSYGYPGGLSLAPIASVQGIALSPASATKRVGTEHCVTATVTDANGGRVPGVRVDFTVTGVHPSTGNSVANGSGEAVYCYTGSNTGDDSITAVVGRISSGPAQVTWNLTDPQLPAASAPVAQADETDPRIRSSRAPSKCRRSGVVSVRFSVRDASAIRGSAIYLDGNRVRMTKRARFTYRVRVTRLRAGAHRVTVRTTDRAGNRSSRTVRFSVCAARRVAPAFTG